MGVVDAIGNGITMRSDFHNLLDYLYIVFVPGATQYVVRFLRPCGPQPHHGAPATLHPRVRNEFLYARFAHAMIYLVNPYWRYPALAVAVPEKVMTVREARNAAKGMAHSHPL